MDPICEHPFFDSGKEKVKRAMEHLKKPKEIFDNSLHSCFKCGSNNVFSVAKQVRSADEETSVFNECATVNGEMDDNFK